MARRSKPDLRGKRGRKVKAVAPKKNMLRCPAPCGKVRAYSEREAWNLAHEFYSRLGGEEPKRVYPCPHDSGVWHWTRRETWDTAWSNS